MVPSVALCSRVHPAGTPSVESTRLADTSSSIASPARTAAGTVTAAFVALTVLVTPAR